MRTPLRSGLAVATTPLLVLAALVGLKQLDPVVAGWAALPVLTVALLLGAAWGRDVARLREAVKQAASGRVVLHGPMLPALGMLHQEIDQLSRLMSERTTLLQRLLKSDEAIVERLPDPLLVLGSDRVIRRANQAARTAFGSELNSVLRHPDLRAALDLALSKGTTQIVELTLRVPLERDVAATVLNLDPPLADGGSILIVLSDRSRERAVERMRTDFIANASHELRTPLASLIGFIGTLQGPAADDPPAQKRFLAIMHDQAERMNRLIDDLLALSRIEVSEHQTPLDAVSLGDLLFSLEEAFAPRVAARHQTLLADIAADLPDVPGDEDQLAQLFQNLLDNAVKYGKEGGTIRLWAGLPPKDATRYPAEPGVVVSVADDGAGIARVHIPRLTERFYRVDKGRSRSVGGTGLGLAIVKHVVARHRGSMWIDSSEGNGACFTVWLPTR